MVPFAEDCGVKFMMHPFDTPNADAPLCSLATAGGFEEVLLDDGDMNMFKILLKLRKVSFNGCVNPDHYPRLEGDGPDSGQSLAYSVGYIKSLLAPLALV